MGNKRDGFLWEDERGLIDAYAGTPGATVEIPKTNPDDEIQLEGDTLNEDLLENVSNVSKVKSRMKRTTATSDNINEILRANRMDLKRLENFYCQVLPQPGGRWYWRDHVLPRLQHELKSLQSLLGSWQEAANSTGDETIRGILSDAMRPLHRGLDELNERLAAIEEGTTDLKSESEGLVDNRQELKARREALFALLRNEDLLELFEFIADNSGRKLPEEKIGGNLWKWWASRTLETEHGLVKEESWGYQLSDRGDLVYEVLSNFEEAPLVRMVGEGEMSTAEAALTLLDHHFPVDHWFR